MSSSCRSLEAERGGGGRRGDVHLDPGSEPSQELGLGLGLGLGLEEVFVFDSKSENRDRAVEAVESVSEARAV